MKAHPPHIIRTSTNTINGSCGTMPTHIATLKETADDLTK